MGRQVRRLARQQKRQEASTNRQEASTNRQVSGFSTLRLHWSKSIVPQTEVSRTEAPCKPANNQHPSRLALILQRIRKARGMEDFDSLVPILTRAHAHSDSMLSTILEDLEVEPDAPVDDRKRR